MIDSYFAVLTYYSKDDMIDSYFAVMTMPLAVSFSSVVIPLNTVSSVELNSDSQNAAAPVHLLPTSFRYRSKDPTGSPGTMVGHVASRLATSIARM